MTMTTLSVLVLYYAVVIVVGFLNFRNQSKSEFVSAPGQTTFGVLTLSLLGTIVGGGMFLGVAEIGFKGGMTAFALGIAYLLGSMFMGLLAPKFRKICREKKVFTLFGLFESLYPSDRKVSITRILIWTTFLVYLVMLSAQFLSIATFLNYYLKIQFDFGLMVGAGIVATITTVCITAFGGFKRDLWTDVIQMFFITLGVGMIIWAEGGDTHLRQNLTLLPPEFFTIGTDGIVFFVGSLFFVAPTFLVRFDLWQRIVTAKSDQGAKNAFIISGIIAFLFFAFFGFLGMYGKTLNIEDGRFVALEVIQQKLHGFQYSLAIAAFFAAVMSTADTFLGVTALALAKATIRRERLSLEGTDDDKIFVQKLRSLTIYVGLGSVLLAYLIQNIVDAFALAFGLLIVFVPALIGGLVRKQPNEFAARWSTILGLLAVFLTVPFDAKAAYLPGIAISALTYFILCRFKHDTKLHPNMETSA